MIKANKVHSIFVERNVLVNTHHPFTLSIRNAFQTDTKVYLVLEYVPGGSIFTMIHQRERIPLTEMQLFVAEISLALNYLHHNHIIYRDLKSENVLFDSQGFLRLTDFRLAKILTI